MAVKKSGLGKGLDSLIADKTPKQKKENTEGGIKYATVLQQMQTNDNEVMNEEIVDNAAG